MEGIPTDDEIDNAWGIVERFIQVNINRITNNDVDLVGNEGDFNSKVVEVLYKAGVSSAMFEYIEVLLKEHLSTKTSIHFLSVLHSKHIDEENEDDDNETFKDEHALNAYIKSQHRNWKRNKLIAFSKSIKEVTSEFQQMSVFVQEFIQCISTAVHNMKNEGSISSCGNNIGGGGGEIASSFSNKSVRKNLNIVAFDRQGQINKILQSLKLVLSTNIFSSIYNHTSSISKQCHHNHAKSAITYLFWVTLKLNEKKWKLENGKQKNTEDSMVSEEEEEEEESDDEEEEEEEEELTEEEELNLLSAIKECWDGMNLLGWLDQEDITQQLSSLIYDEIHEHVNKVISGEFATPKLDKLISRCKGTVLPTLHMMFGSGTCQDLGVDGFFGRWEDKIVCWVQNAFCDSRISELYDCILDFPDSEVAVLELRQALEVTQLHSKLAVELRQTLKRRLLHPGATTGQIIDIYISTIKVLRLLDSSSDGVLDAVAGPLRDYLRERKDCVRRIVTSLTDEEADLYEELQRNSGNEGHEFGGGDEENQEDESVDWQPQLRSVALMKRLNGVVQDKMNEKSGKEKVDKKFDILGNLLSIYGSKEVFIDEYRVMLCSRLLKNYNYDTSRDVATLELLKLRFGDSILYQCEIMIRDIDESKRLNTGIHGKLMADRSQSSQYTPLSSATATRTAIPAYESKKGSVVNASVVSEHFWPSLQDNDGIILHPVATELLAQYNQTYALMKKPRELKWREQLGLVDLDLEFSFDEDDQEDTTLHFQVSPLHATLILHFDEDDVTNQTSTMDDDGSKGEQKEKSLTVSQLVQLTGLDSDEVMKKMEFWANEGIVAVTSITPSEGESEYSYQVEKFPFASGSRREKKVVMDMEMMEDSSLSNKANSANQTKVFRNFVTGMLKNLDSMPLERIHNMLKMYTTDSDTKYEMSTHELGEFLNDMISEDLVEYSGGEYKLVRK